MSGVKACCAHFLQGPLLVTLAGAFFAFKGYEAVALGHQSESWQRVKATVTESATIASNSGGKPHTSYRFEYTYTVDGAHFTSSRYHFKTGTNYEAVSSLTVGERITAHYDPRDPGQATVVTGSSVLNYLWLVAGIGIVGVGLSWSMSSCGSTCPASQVPHTQP